MASYNTTLEVEEPREQHNALPEPKTPLETASPYSFSDSSCSSEIDLAHATVALGQHLLNAGGSQFASGSFGPANFATIVDQRIYRCGYPTPENYAFLRALGLKTIITLVDKEIPVPYVQFIAEAGIRHVICPITPNKGDHKRTTVKQIAAALTVMMDPTNQPVLIHCNKGKHRSGCVTASFRKCLGMSMEGILEEYGQHAGEKARELDIAFIRAFDEKHFLGSIRRDPLATMAQAHELEHILDPASALGRVSRPRS